MKITVFGGSQAREGSDAYLQAQALGDLLARRGYTVLTGGYMGTMEAVSRGAAEAGGHVIGVTCEEIGRWHGRSANNWVSEEWKQTTLIQRLEVLIRTADAAVALPGGPGTLAEIALMWNLIIVGSLPPRPLILVGRAWNQVMDSFYENLGEYSPAAQRSLLRFALTPQLSIKLLEEMAS
jgi:uncharacterized protein (TIGR00730 family)